MNLKKILLVFLLSTPALQADTMKEFLAADTAMARHLLHKFSDAELQRHYNEFKKNRSQAELRSLWLFEEMKSREADRIATERLKYLFIALISLFLWLILSVVYLWRRQNRA